MNKADVEFTVGLNTSPAERQLDLLDKKVKASSHIYSQVFKDMGPGGFKMVGQPYQNGNNFGVPSVQVLERSLSTVTNAMERFARIAEIMAARMVNLMVNFTTVDKPYSSTPRTIYATNNVAGYLPYNTSPNIRPWSPTEYYTRAQVNAINDPNKVFDYLMQKRMAEQNNPYMGVYGTFNNLHSSQGASGMYDIWKGLFGNRGLLALPAPLQTSEDNKTQEEQSKEVFEEDKKDNDELKHKLKLWGGILATVYSLKKVLEGLSKIWKFGAETVSNVNSNINEESGFFSTDPEGALRANSDKTRALLYAGIRNMGENAPVTKSGMDYATSKITEMWTAAMSGRNVDARTTIDVQRLKDFFGIDLSVAGLLTGEREGKTATDIQLDMMEKVEKQISKLAEADEIEKGQVIDSLKNILGNELIDAIVANANKNLKIENPELRVTLGEILMQHGGSAVPAGNLTEPTTEAVKSISELNDAIQQLKNTLVTQFGPAFSAVTKALTNGIEWINEKLNKVEGEKNALGEVKNKVSLASLTSNEYSRYRNFKQKENDEKDKYKDKEKLIRDALRDKDPIKILDALYLAQPETKSAADIENLMIKQQEVTVGDYLSQGYFDPNSDNPIIKALANKPYYYKGVKYTGYDAFKMELGTGENLSWDTDDIKRLFYNYEDMSEYERLLAIRNFVKLNPDARNAFTLGFDKGGAFDFNTDMGIFKYLYGIKNFGSYDEQYQALKALSKESYKVLDNTVNMDTTWNDLNKNGKVDMGEVEVTLVVKDQYGTIITKKDIQGELQ